MFLIMSKVCNILVAVLNLVSLFKCFPFVPGTLTSVV